MISGSLASQLQPACHRSFIIAAPTRLSSLVIIPALTRLSSLVIIPALTRLPSAPTARLSSQL